MKVEIDNLGIPPLAGVCSYEEAFKPGYSVDYNVSLLKRFNYVKSQLNLIFAAHLARTPEWEVKCAISLHMWLEAEHAASIRKRVTEMREPPHDLDKIPDPKLERLMEEIIRSEDTIELLTAIYAVIKPEMIRSIQKHMEETNPLTDYPTRRVLSQVLHEEKQMLSWGEQALTALNKSKENRARAKQWQNHLQTLLADAGGIFGDLAGTVETDDAGLRSDGRPYEMDVMPQRDARFVDPYNRSGLIDSYFQDETREYDERTYALLYKRLREMDVPEWMGPIIYKAAGKPWEYYVDMSRQLWDEARHAMMGEVGLVAHGVPFYKYPIDITSSVSLNNDLEPFEAHLILWAIEQGLMNKNTGKRWEWLIAGQSDYPLAAMFQDYDWADEVLHTQIGRKWLLPETGGMEKMQELAQPLWKKWSDASGKLHSLSTHEPWWDAFIRDIRSQRELAAKA